MDTYTLEQVENWIDDNMFIGSPAAARTAMESAASLPKLQASRERAVHTLQVKHGSVIERDHTPLALAFREMENVGHVAIEAASQEGFIKVTLLW